MAPVDILNAIAHSQKLRTSLGYFIFNIKTEDELDDYMDKSASVLYSQGFNHSVVSASLELIPLLLENIAISKFIVENDFLDLRMALPEILNPAEALLYAKGDYRNINDSSELQNQFLFLMNKIVEEQDFLIENKS